MAAGLGFKTFATGDVLTAGDTNSYLMQGVWVFADAAARSAAVTSPQEGNMSFLKDTNSTEYYDGSAWVAIGGGGSSPLTTKGDLYTYSTTDARLGVGTNGQVLTADSAEATGLKWATAGGGSGLTLISTVTMSAVSAQNLEGVFTSTYTNYYVVLSGLLGSAAGVVPRIQYLYSTNTVQSAQYAGGFTGINYSGTSDSDNVANTYAQTQISLPALADTTASGGTMTFFAPNENNGKQPVIVDWASQYYGWRYAGGWATQSRAYTGLRFTTASGTMSGTISVYGLAK